MDVHYSNCNLNGEARACCIIIDAIRVFKLSKLSHLPEVQEVTWNIVLSEIKFTTELPIWCTSPDSERRSPSAAITVPKAIELFGVKYDPQICCLSLFAMIYPVCEIYCGNLKP
jgi:hypothetical protein